MASRGVRVLIRFRPQSNIEDAKGGTLNTHIQHSADAPETEVAYGDPATTTAYNPPKRFTFDHIFQPKSAQDDVYATVGKPAVDAVLDGYNGTILAYGQTGSGKTHTMLGPSGGSAELLASDQRGVVPRVLDDLLARLQQFDTAEIAWSVQLSVLELYNEELFDLGPADGSASIDGAAEDGGGGDLLRIREDRTSGRGVYVEGLRCVSVKDATQALDVIAGAARRKHTAGTQANETSSRSHTIVQLFVAQTNHAEGGTKTTAQLFLVDLAGSERIDKTSAAGQRLKEAQNINLSLTLLGNVINKLTDGKALHIPYRDSKLTRLLQDSLGGNSVTTLLCACSPSTFNASETLSTLQFANRAKKIENKPRANKVLSDDELRKAYNKALDEIRILTDRIHTLEGLESKEKGGGGGAPPAAMMAAGAGGSGAKAAMAARKQQQQHGDDDGGSSGDATLVTELRETVASLSKELKEMREEVQAHDSTAEQLRTRITFWVDKEKAAQEKAAEWKVKFDREKLACDSWARKFNGLVTAAPGSGRRSASSSATTTAASSGGKPAAAGSGSFRRSKAAASGGTKKATAGKTDAPPTPPSASADPDATPEEREARALVRERMMLQQLDELRDKLNVTHKYPIIIERLTKDLELLREESERKLERQVAESEALLQRQDEEIGRLQLKLDERQAQAQRESRNTSDTVGDLARLKAENEILHEENRANAGRLIAFAKKGETLEKSNAELVAERDRLHREIEASALTDAQKSRILGDALRAQKSNFRKRLLECFSRDDD